MDTPVALPAHVSFDAEGRIDVDLQYRACGYNLRSLSLQARCPECGTAVGRSVHGDHLRFCDPAWVDRIASGMNWIVVGLCLGLISGFASGGIGAAVGMRSAASGGTAAPTQSFQLIGVLLGLALGLVSLIGYWKVTTPDPGRTEAEEGLTVRKVVRAAYAASFVLGIIQQLLAISAPLAGQILTIPGLIVGLTGTVAIFLYARSLALRIPDDGLARSTRTVMWGFVCTFAVAIVLGVVALVLYSTGALGKTGAGILAGAGGCAVSVSFLVFGIWSLVLIFRYRSALNRAAGQARATWAAGAPA